MKPMNDYMEAAEAHVLHTYNRFPIVLEKGDGVYLYDTDGKKYLDFAAGIAVFGLGYQYQIGRAHVLTPVTLRYLVFRLML